MNEFNKSLFIKLWDAAKSILKAEGVFSPQSELHVRSVWFEDEFYNIANQRKPKEEFLSENKEENLNSEQHLKYAASLLNRWLDDPDESTIVPDTYSFIRNFERDL